ncbi:MAG: TetR/AcrR family transcriptional regulator [Rhizobiaceae bacterium]|nr:TetR/AcrR family transcriptional regulator [Rhizobiaceae bacterium]
MARPASGNKERDIRNATVAEVAAVGSTAVSVNKIAKRAGVSVGTIYRFYETKDDLLFAVYLAVKTDIHNAIMGATNAQQKTEDKIRAMWFGLVEYAIKAPQDFLFVEMLAPEARVNSRNTSALDDMRNEILQQIEDGITNGILVKAGTRSIELMLAAPAISLAKRASLMGTVPDQEQLNEVFSLVWASISNH